MEEAPELLESNDEALDVFYGLLGVAQRDEIERGSGTSTRFTIQPSEFNSMCDIREIAHDKRFLTWIKVEGLQSVWNKHRKIRKKDSPGSPGRGLPRTRRPRRR